MKVALVHDWLTGMRGGEKVLEVFCDLFPSADLFTLLHVPGSVSAKIESHKITASWLSRMPAVRKRYRHYLPLMPWAAESLDLSGYDLVISTSHCVAKGVRPAPGAVHICCCFTPMRYIWDQYGQYFGSESSASLPVKAAMGLIRPLLQRWDRGSSSRVTEFIAISKFVADRIRKQYGRGSEVIYPHADTGFYTPGTRTEPTGPYLIVSAFAPYKKLDLAIEAFNLMKKPFQLPAASQC
jgi:glycosyltransferase involved in cell wall biosynthesis